MCCFYDVFFQLQVLSVPAVFGDMGTNQSPGPDLDRWTQDTIRHAGSVQEVQESLHPAAGPEESPSNRKCSVPQKASAGGRV